MAIVYTEVTRQAGDPAWWPTHIEKRRSNKPAYAWPGGYPIVYYTSSGDVLCPTCAATDDEQTTGDIFYEGPPEHCCNCNSEIASAYGDPAAEEE